MSKPFFIPCNLISLIVKKCVGRARPACDTPELCPSSYEIVKSLRNIGCTYTTCVLEEGGWPYAI